MALERGKFGIEYNPRQRESRDSSGLGWVFVVVAVVALVSLSWTIVKRVRASHETETEAVETQTQPTTTVKPPAAEEKKVEGAKVDTPKTPPVPVAEPSDLDKRPPMVRNLLMKLDEAKRRRDVEMEVDTIERLRALPGSPAADLDDALARRLGALNITRLFDRKNRQWVKEVVIKRGDRASRIAVENGSTLASLARLNGGNIDHIVLGRKLYVMDHPRFNLVVHRRSRTADLSLNGKFFKRYDLVGEVGSKAGAYELPEKKRVFWGDTGVQFKPADRDELEMLLPAGTTVLISEM